jgi:hypothetical protein
MMRAKLRLPATLTLLAIAGAMVPREAAAEVFLLRSGGQIEGEHLNPQRPAGSPYLVLTDGGVRLSLADNMVRMVVVRSELQKQYDELLPSVPHTAAGHWAMAEWCLERGLLDERKRHLASVIELEPDHEAARKALGYERYGRQWLTTDEYMKSQGYVRHKGRWWTQQAKDLDEFKSARDQTVKDWRVEIRRAFNNLSNPRLAAAAERDLANVRDPLAAPALAEILADAKQPRSVRQQCLEMLGKLPPGLATETLVKLAMDDRDENIRDRCLDELRRQGAPLATSAFSRELKSKDNRRVNRAALCLQRLGDRQATLPLIEALVTEHTFLVTPGGGGGGGGGLPLAFGAGGPVGAGGGGGLGGLAVGGKPQRVKKNIENKLVRDALTHLNPGVNFLYDVDAWRKWYIDTHTSTNVDLRRDE